MSAEIVKLVDHGRADLSDVPLMLRRLADRYEAGEYGEDQTIFIVIPQNGDYPIVQGFGMVEGPRDPLVQLDLARAGILNHVVRRAP